MLDTHTGRGQFKENGFILCYIFLKLIPIKSRP